MKILSVFLALFLITPAGWAEQAPLKLTLKEALVMAKNQNAQVIVASERIRQSLAEISTSRAVLLPQLTGIFGGRRQTSDLRASGISLPGDPHVGPFNSFDTRARITMDIFDPAAISRLQAAKAGSRLSQNQLIRVRQDVLALVGSMYLEAERSAQAIDLSRVALKHMEHNYQVAESRFKQGTGSASDLDKAKMDLTQSQYALEISLTRAEKTRLDLASALKISLDQVIVFEDDHSWVEKQLEQAKILPEVAVAESQVEQSKANENAARGGFWPKVTASGDYGRLGESPSASSNTYTLGIGVSVPFWEGGAKQAELEKAKSKLKESEVLLKDAKDQNELKIRQANKDVEQAAAFLRFKMQQMQYAKRQLDIAKDQFKTGLGSQLQLDQAEASQALSLDEKNEALATFWTAKLNLAHAMGNIEEIL